MLVCKICNSEFTNSKHLNINKITINPDRYLHTCKECRLLRKCKNCNILFKHHQNQTCSHTCANKLKEKTYMLSQGAPHNFSKNSKCKQKITNDLLEKHGVINQFAVPNTKKKIAETMLRKYGVDNISKNSDIKLRKKNTLGASILNNPNLLKDSWWKNHHTFIKELGYDPRLGRFGKASNESLLVFNEVESFCKSIGISDNDIFIGAGNKSEFFIHDGTRIYFYDFCIKSKKIIIEFHGTGFHANPNWESSKLDSWKSCFTGETSKENIEKTLIKNTIAITRGYSLLEIWSDISPEENINICKQFITKHYEN